MTETTTSEATGTILDLERRANQIRRKTVEMCASRGQGYAGQGLQLADIFAVLYFHEMREPTADPPGDRFVLSVGHSAIAIYAALGVHGVFDDEQLATYGADGSHFEESPLETMTGFTITGGSLGQGLSQALGLALAERLTGSGRRTYCVFSDGELQEGQTMEAIQAAGSYGIDNLIAILDNNGEQADGLTADIIQVEPVPERLASYGWDVQRVDGHDIGALVEAFAAAHEPNGKPKAIVCDTIPGHGVPILSSTFDRVHYVRATPDVWEQALAEVDETDRRLGVEA